MSLPYSWEQFLRIHDAAMKTWLEGLHVDYGDGSAKGPGGNPPVFDPPRQDVPIIAVMASPDRAFAAAADLLINTGMVTGGAQKAWQDEVVKLNGLPLPIASIYRGDPQRDPSMAGVPKRFPLSQAQPNTIVQYWRAYRIPYQIDFWQRYVYTDSFIREWMEVQFGGIGNEENETYITVTHTPPYGDKRQSLLNQGSQDNSDLEGNQTRYKRFTYSLSLRGWFITNPLT